MFLMEKNPGNNQILEVIYFYVLPLNQIFDTSK